jgi:serine/threonine protein kinase
VYALPNQDSGDGEAALKVLRLPDRGGGAWAADYVREVSVWASIRPHSNIVSLLGVGCVEAGGAPAISTELVTGTNLHLCIHPPSHKRNRSQPLPWSVSFKACAAVARALMHLHGHAPPIIHRDVKPGNVLVSFDGSSIKLCDFGLALWRTGRHVEPCKAAGSPGYMAPELLQVETATAPPPPSSESSSHKANPHLTTAK